MKTYVKFSLGLSTCGTCLLLLASLHAQESSRVIPFNNVPTTIAPSSTAQVLTIQLWDAAAAGTVLYCENQTLEVNPGGAISFTFGAGTAPAPACASGPPGLKPQDFPSGASRFLDVVDATAASVLPNPPGRISLTAVAFALSAPTNNVPANLTMVNSSAAAGNIPKDGVLFLHNFGTSNTFLGSNAGNLAMTGSYNTANGTNSLRNNTAGYSNTASGDSALSSNTTGYSNTATSVSALRNNTQGFFNTATGESALSKNTLGDSNTATGAYSMGGNITGKGNTAMGLSALRENTAGDQNTAVGVAALQNNSESNNTALGAFSLFSNTTGNRNTAVGVNALRGNFTSYNNTAIGVSALENNFGLENTAIGAFALQNSSAGSNTATGSYALQLNRGGYQNTASGHSALYGNESGDNNTAVGFRALFSGNGRFNTAIGSNALATNISGVSNIALGANAGYYVQYGTNNVNIGNTGAEESNTPRIGSNQTRFFAAGIRYTGVTGLQVYVDTWGQLGVMSSSKRFKEEIHAMSDSTARLRKLRPVTFFYKQDKPDAPRQLQYGLIAEEVAAVYPELVDYADTGEPFSVRYHLLAPMLLNELQKQGRLIEQQQKEIHAQAVQLIELKAQAAKVTELQAQQAAIAGRLKQLDREDNLKTAANANRPTP